MGKKKWSQKKSWAYALSPKRGKSFEEFSSKEPSGQCIHCLGSFENLTRDHICPESWYPPGYPEFSMNFLRGRGPTRWMRDWISSSERLPERELTVPFALAWNGALSALLSVWASVRPYLFRMEASRYLASKIDLPDSRGFSLKQEMTRVTLGFGLLRKICWSNRGQGERQVNDRVRFLESQRSENHTTFSRSISPWY